MHWNYQFHPLEVSAWMARVKMYAQSAPQKRSCQIQENGLRVVQRHFPLQNHLEQPDHRHRGS